MVTESSVIFGTSDMRRAPGIFDSQRNEPVVYASFSPSQIGFKFDFWEKGFRSDGADEPIEGGTGPAGEMYMAKTELRNYLRWHAQWSD